jgi:hypothetical protein
MIEYFSHAHVSLGTYLSICSCTVFTTPVTSNCEDTHISTVPLHKHIYVSYNISAVHAHTLELVRVIYLFKHTEQTKPILNWLLMKI